MTEGVYESHHLLCPIHGRTIGDGWRASCGCQPHIMWEQFPTESEMYNLDNLNIGSRYV